MEPDSFLDYPALALVQLIEAFQGLDLWQQATSASAMLGAALALAWRVDVLRRKTDRAVADIGKRDAAVEAADKRRADAEQALAAAEALSPEGFIAELDRAYDQYMPSHMVRAATAYLARNEVAQRRAHEAMFAHHLAYAPLDEAAAYRAALPHIEGYLHASPDDKRVRGLLEDVRIGLGEAKKVQPKPDASRKISNEILEHKIRVEPEDLTDLGILHGNRGRYRLAELLLGHVADRERRDAFPKAERKIAATSDWAWALICCGEASRAATELSATLHGADKDPGADHRVTLEARSKLAWALLRSGKTEAAHSLLITIIGPLTKILGADAHETLSSRDRLAEAQLAQGRAAEAEAALRALLPDRERVQGASHPDTLATRASIAQAQLAQGRAAEAEAALRVLLPELERVQGASHPGTLNTRFSIARAQLAQGRAAEAEAAWRALLPDYERVQGASHPDTLTTRAVLVAGRARLGDVAGAREAAGGLPEDLAAVYGDGNPRIGRVLVPLGELAAAEGDRDAAARRFDAAEALYRGKLVPEAFQFRELAEARARWLPTPAEPGA